MLRHTDDTEGEAIGEADDDGETTGEIVTMLLGRLQLSVWQQEESPINSVLFLSIHCEVQ